MKGLSRQMCLSGVILAAFAGFDYAGRVAHGSRPVEALAKGVAYKGSRCDVETIAPPWMSMSGLMPSLVGMQRCILLVTLHL